MSFWSIARNAAAAESGRLRAEQYRRRAMRLRIMGGQRPTATRD